MATEGTSPSQPQPHSAFCSMGNRVKRHQDPAFATRPLQVGLIIDRHDRYRDGCLLPAHQPELRVRDQRRWRAGPVNAACVVGAVSGEALASPLRCGSEGVFLCHAPVRSGGYAAACRLPSTRLPFTANDRPGSEEEGVEPRRLTVTKRHRGEVQDVLEQVHEEE